jgi:hypothetical protein
MRIIYRRPFVTWCLYTALTVSFMIWLYQEGVLSRAIKHDDFFVVSIIAAWYALASLAVGYAAHRSEGGHDVSDTLTFAWFSSANLLNLGLCGTVYGFIAMLTTSFSGTDFANPEVIPSLLPLIGSNWATALYATAAGITFNVLLSIQAFFVDYSFRTKIAETEAAAAVEFEKELTNKFGVEVTK